MRTAIAAAFNAAVTTFIAVVALCAVAPARAAAPVPYLPVPKGAAVILNTGSTNAVGYRIVVDPSGRVEYVHGSDRRTASISAHLTATFFADMTHAMPLSRVHVLACMKSASFGYETYVWWRGQRSPDISCSGGAQADALFKDAQAIAAALALGGSVTLPPNEPRKVLPSPASSASPADTRPTDRPAALTPKT